MHKVLYLFATLIALSITARADPIYYDTFTLTEIAAQGTPLAFTEVVTFVLPAVSTPDIVNCEPPFPYCALIYLDVPLTITGARPFGDVPNPGNVVIDGFNNGVTAGGLSVDEISNFFPFEPYSGSPYTPQFPTGEWISHRLAPDLLILDITSDTPEPSTFVLLGTGAISVFGMAKRRLR